MLAFMHTTKLDPLMRAQGDDNSHVEFGADCMMLQHQPDYNCHGLTVVDEKRQQAPVKNISIRQLLPDTDFFMTYEGSTTMPGCHETVTWIILNKPIYITKQQLHALRKLMQGDKEHPKAPLGSNFRSPLPLHHRPVRTNIDFKGKQGKHCPTMYHEMYYKVLFAANMFP
uniref:Alpha-carbonic anhydrase domain-containing protein n=1 Tax=Strigamia maritima TaxID=126957 RepID=T1JAV0_STRMM